MVVVTVLVSRWLVFLLLRRHSLARIGGLLQLVAAEGRGAHVSADRSRESRNDLFRQAMRSSSHVNRIFATGFDHILEQERLFQRLTLKSELGSVLVSSSGRRGGSDEVRHARDGRPGLLVDTGAVSPLTGSASARSVVEATTAQGLKVVLQDLPMPEHMRGLGGLHEVQPGCVASRRAARRDGIYLFNISL